MPLIRIWVCFSAFWGAALRMGVWLLINWIIRDRKFEAARAALRRLPAPKAADVIETMPTQQAASDAPIKTLMDPHPDFFYTTDSAEHAARQAVRAGDLVYPVVDWEQRLVGILPLADADIGRVACKEIRTGLLVGLLLAALAFLIACLAF